VVKRDYERGRPAAEEEDRLLFPQGERTGREE